MSRSLYHIPFTIDQPARYPTQLFLKRVMKSGPRDECIEWPFKLDPDGYGRIRYAGINARAHRVVCELAHGKPATDGLLAAHSCNNRACVNPRHLSWKTPQGNADDMVVHGTIALISGEHNGRALLKESQVAEIRSLAGELSQRKIAKLFNVSPNTIWDIVHRRKWRHVP